MEKLEYWWGGTSVDGAILPFDRTTSISHDFTLSAPNQTMPMYLSSHGRCIWSDEPFTVEISDGVFSIEGVNVTMESFGSTLRDAYIGAMCKHFPPSGAKLPEEFFKVPQYNTWIQLTYNQTQQGVLDYAHQIIDNGFKPGILMIDEGWQEEYGVWRFDKYKFPDPKAMVDELHQMGFIVMLWVVPYVSPNGLFFIDHILKAHCPDLYRDYFLRNTEGDPALIFWWNGYSAVLDFTKKCDRDLFDSQLHLLMDEIGIDGFKFDGGTLQAYGNTAIRNGRVNEDYTPAERNIAWNDYGTQYKYHEYKDTFKGGGKRVIQRIRDRAHSWDGDGINTLVPNALIQGILGHPFVCPDMIGGGDYAIRMSDRIDEELFVRMAQCSALFPMMQFSWAPWEALSKDNLSIVKAAHDMHNEFSETILKLVEDAYCTGEPIMRSLEYNYPHCGYEKINTVFMLGDEILVAPVMQKGVTHMEIPLPEGHWLAFNGNEYIGGTTVTVPVTIKDLPYFKKI